MIKAIKILIEVIGWLAIAGCPLLGAGLISLFVYLKWENKVFAIAILFIGFIIGAIWATRISIKYGTMEWLSQIRRIS
jgi:hypothetical protein